MKLRGKQLEVDERKGETVGKASQGIPGISWKRVQDVRAGEWDGSPMEAEVH